MVMTKAALGMPLLDCWRALTAATMSVAAHTSKALPWGSASRSNTDPVWARDHARFVAKVVLPNPPFLYSVGCLDVVCSDGVAFRCYRGFRCQNPANCPHSLLV